MISQITGQKISIALQGAIEGGVKPALLNLKECFNPDPKPVKSEKKSRKPMRKVSKKMAIALRENKPLKEQHLADHPDCQVRLIGCTNRNNTVHHSAKRGKNLNNKETFLTVCHHCHNRIEFVLSAKERREKGYLL